MRGKIATEALVASTCAPLLDQAHGPKLVSKRNRMTTPSDLLKFPLLHLDDWSTWVLVFGIGAMAAGFAGIVNAPVVSIAPDVGEAIQE